MSLRYLENQSCSSCGGKMLMYYSPYCPDCTPKAKIKKNLIQSIDYIEHKYGIQTRDYGATKAGIKDSIKFNVDHQEAWKERFAPIPVFDLRSEDPVSLKTWNELRAAQNKAQDELIKFIIDNLVGLTKEFK